VALPGDTIVFGLMLFACFIPFQIVLIPMARMLGLMGPGGSTPGLVLVHVVYGLGFTTLYFRNYYASFPTELVRAAMMDGAGFFRIFWRIMLPVSGPIAVVSVIWQFTNIWNDFLFGASFASGSAAPMTGGAQQPRQLLDGCEGIQRPLRGRDPGRAAHPPRLHRRGPLLRARPDGGLGKG
jgi:ABC-type glycerol-3-phosphate transport system permease component